MSCHLKKITIVLLAGLCCLSGCKKKVYTCGFSYYYNPAYVAFCGFTASELSLVVTERYEASSNFSNLLGTNSLDASAAHFANDTAYNTDNHGFFTVETGVDLKITFPKAGRTFRITDVRQFESGYHWEQEKHCASGGSQPRIRSYGFNVDGVNYTPFERTINNWYIYLGK